MQLFAYDNDSRVSRIHDTVNEVIEQVFTYTYDANSNRKIIEDLNGQGGRGEFRIAPTLGGTGERSRRPSSCANWSRPYTSVKTPHDLILQQFSVKPIDGDWRLAFLIAIGKST